MALEMEGGRAMHGEMERRRQSPVFNRWRHRKVGVVDVSGGSKGQFGNTEPLPSFKKAFAG